MRPNGEISPNLVTLSGGRPHFSGRNRSTANGGVIDRPKKVRFRGPCFFAGTSKMKTVRKFLPKMYI
jgi:hypothetical protein